MSRFTLAVCSGYALASILAAVLAFSPMAVGEATFWFVVTGVPWNVIIPVLINQVDHDVAHQGAGWIAVFATAFNGVILYGLLRRGDRARQAQA